MVFKKAQELDIPIFMVTSGGYQSQTAGVIANSIRNLEAKGLLPGKWPNRSEGQCAADTKDLPLHQECPNTSEPTGSSV